MLIKEVQFDSFGLLPLQPQCREAFSLCAGKLYGFGVRRLSASGVHVEGGGSVESNQRDWRSRHGSVGNLSVTLMEKAIFPAEV